MRLTLGPVQLGGGREDTTVVNALRWPAYPPVRALYASVTVRIVRPIVLTLGLAGRAAYEVVIDGRARSHACRPISTGGARIARGERRVRSRVRIALGLAGTVRVHDTVRRGWCAHSLAVSVEPAGAPHALGEGAVGRLSGEALANAAGRLRSVQDVVGGNDLATVRVLVFACDPTLIVGTWCAPASFRVVGVVGAALDHFVLAVRVLHGSYIMVIQNVHTLVRTAVADRVLRARGAHVFVDVAPGLICGAL